MNFTIFGGHGFIGNALCNHLRAQGHEVFIPSRDASDITGRQLYHVVYAVGLTGDFRKRLYETIEAHVCFLARCLAKAEFESWSYLSSTRVYAGLSDELATEASSLAVVPEPDGVYNLSKLTGEAICLSHPSERVRVIRLANVYGPRQNGDTFLGMLFRDIELGRNIKIDEAPASSKDYVAIEDVCQLVEKISLYGRHRIYNVASGKAVCHADIARVISEKTAAKVTFANDAPHRAFPRIDIARVVEEFGFLPRELLDQLSGDWWPIESR